MNKIGVIVWYKFQPLKEGRYYGTPKDWNQTLLTSINKANATLVHYALNNLLGDDSEVPATPKPKRKLTIASNLVDLVESLESYDTYSQRYNTSYSKSLPENMIQLIDGDNYVEIILKNEHKPD